MGAGPALLGSREGRSFSMWRSVVSLSRGSPRSRGSVSPIRVDSGTHRWVCGRLLPSCSHRVNQLIRSFVRVASRHPQLWEEAGGHLLPLHVLQLGQASWGPDDTDKDPERIRAR